MGASQNQKTKDNFLNHPDAAECVSLCGIFSIPWQVLEKNRGMLYNKIDFVWNGEKGISFLPEKQEIHEWKKNGSCMRPQW